METITLDGRSLDFEKFKKIVFERAEITLDLEALKKVDSARKVLFSMSEKGNPVYGLNRGVGWNKDKEFSRDFFEQYNKNLLNTHCLGITPNSTEEEVRAMMLLRLNSALCGSTGISVENLNYYKEFLNKQIHPIVPRRGSIGEGDITTLSHIGLAFIGETDVIYKGERVNSLYAMGKEDLKPAILGPKDGLSMISTNAQGAALATIAVIETEEIIELSNLIYCLGLEGLNGGVDPINERVSEIGRMPGQKECARKCRIHLRNSYLYKFDSKRALQDPLSYRCSSAIHGSVLDALNYVKGVLSIQMNRSDDNPSIVIEESKTYVSSNFEITTLAIGLEMLTIALSHLSKTACYRTVKLSDPNFTGLSRFLTPEDVKTIAYGTIQKTFTYLDTENRMYANPSSMDFYSLAGNIEDHASNLPLIADKVIKIIDNIRYILGIEMMHAVQAIDLRKKQRLGMNLGVNTEKAYNLIRKYIPYYEKDRNISIDIQKAYDLIVSKEFDNIINNI